MKANELRIGNLVAVNNINHHPELKGEFTEVIGIYESINNKCEEMHSMRIKHFNIHGYYDEYAQYIKFIEPIPLTEAWLLKFGFEKINHISGYSFFNLKRNKRKSNLPSICIYNNYTRVGNNTSVMHCEYVHQLQNLYFALTGEELIINQ